MLDSLTLEQWIIIGFLVGVPLFAAVIVLVAWIGKNAGSWARNLYGWVRARIVGIVAVIFGLMAVAGLVLLYFWTRNDVFMTLSVPLLLIVSFIAVVYFMMPHPKYLPRAKRH